MPRPKTSQKKRKTRRINYNQISDILGKAVHSANWRKKLLASPEEVLRKTYFEPHPAAVAFIKSLKASGFDKAAKRFKPHNRLAKFTRES